MNNSRRTIFLFVAVVGALWGVFDGVLVRPMTNICTILFFLFFLRYKISKGLWTKRWQDNFISLFVLCLVINFIASWINREQTPFDSIRNDEVKNMFLLMSFYVLCRIKSNINNIEKSILALYFTFLICYFIQFLFFFPHPVFAMIGINNDNFTEANSEGRFRFVSQLIGFLGYFFCLNRLLTEKKKWFLYLCGSFLGILFVLVLGFRSGLAAILIASGYLTFKVKGLSRQIIKYLFMSIVFGGVLLQMPIVQKQIDNMIERQLSGESFDNDDYVRVAQFNYFVNKHFISKYDYFFGSGLPSPYSKYGKDFNDTKAVAENTGQDKGGGIYGWVDWGIVGLSWMAGVPMGILLYGFLLFMIFRKYEKKDLYIPSLYLFLLLTSATTIEFYRQGAYVYHALILYLTVYLDKEKLQKAISLQRVNNVMNK